jgi:hypothetical protein
MTEVLILLAGLEYPAVMALVDCVNRPETHFRGGAEDRRAWVRWLIVAVLTAWVLVGNGIVLGYYFSVIRNNDPAGPD